MSGHPAVVHSDMPAMSADVAIRDLPLLARLAEADLRALASTGTEQSFAPSAVIFHEGDPGDALHVVLQGRIRISVLSRQGTEVTLAQMGAGDCFGDLALLDGRPRSATATAVTAARTFVVMRSKFLAWVQPRPAAALALLETLSLRLRRTDEALADLVFLDLPQRLAKHLMRLGGESGPSGTRIRITQAQLATELSVTRESINKQLNQFARLGWITLARGAILIRDQEALKEFV